MSPGLTLSLCAGGSESWSPSSPWLLRKPLPHRRVRSPSRPSRPSQAPQTPGLWLQPSSLSSLVSAFCVPLCTPGPKDPDLGWETDPPGERLATAQLSGVPARYGGAPVGFCHCGPSAPRGLWGNPSPGAACLPLPGSLSPQVGLGCGPGDSCQPGRQPVPPAPAPSPGPWRLHPCLHPLTELCMFH